MSEVEEYGKFIAKRDELVAVGYALLNIFKQMELTEKHDILLKGADRLKTEGFRLLVLGEFNAGKSTLINALLGTAALPRFAVETTAIINEVKWGATPRALLHVKDGTTKEVPFNELEQHVTVGGLGIDDPMDGMKDAPYSKIEIFYPIELCKNGVEIIDSPGLNAHEMRERITLDYMTQVDAVLFVTNATALGNLSELRVIDNVVKPAGHEDIFFVANKADWLQPRELEQVTKVAAKKLGTRTKRGIDRIFFLNALGALEGRINNDSDKLVASGIIPLERSLQEFLVKDRGSTKLIRAALEFRHGLREARALVPEQIKLLQLEHATFEDRVKAAERPLNLLQERRRALISDVNIRLLDIKQEVIKKSYDFLRNTAVLVTDWEHGITLDNTLSISLSQSKTKNEIEVMSTELIGKLNDCFQDHFAKWQVDELQPYLIERMSQILNEMKDEIEKFGEDIDKVRFELTFGRFGGSSPSGNSPPSTFERIASAAGGFLLLDAGAAVTGATFGFKAMLRSAVPQLGIIIAGIALGIGAAFIFPVTLVYAWWNAVRNKEKSIKGLRQHVSQQFAKEMADKAHENAGELGEGSYRALTAFRDIINTGLEAQIDTIMAQVKSVQAERKKGEASVARRIQTLENLRLDVDVIDGRLDDVLAQVATGAYTSRTH